MRFKKLIPGISAINSTIFTAIVTKTTASTRVRKKAIPFIIFSDTAVAA